MIICEGKELPDNFEGYQTAELLKIWEEIQGDGTKASENQILAMRGLIREYRLGIFGAHDRAKSGKEKNLK